MKGKRASILGYPVDIISADKAVDFTEKLIENHKRAHVVTLNPEMISRANIIPELETALKSADLVLPDGIGIIWGLLRLGIKTEQVPGIEYSEKLIDLCAKKGYKVGFLGASQEVISEAVKNMQNKYPDLNIVFQHNGFFNDDEEKIIFEEIKTASIQVLFVALGVPKQELLISKYTKFFDRTIMVGVGGSFDVWANKVNRAPLVFRKLGLEWLFRLLSQPSRFGRMFPTLPLFLIKVMLRSDLNRKEY